MEIQGYRVNFLGDSITEGVGVADRAACRYDNRLAQRFSFSAVNNYGVSGTRLAHQHRPSEKPRYDLCFCGRAYDMDTAADMVIVYGGVNDYIHGDAPFGALGDTTPATFCGGVYFLMHYLLETYRNKPVVFLTPARCFTPTSDDLYPSRHPYKQSDARPLLPYVDVILETAGRLRLPALDLYRTLGVDPHDAEQRRAFTADGLHFNDAGHALLADRLSAFLCAL